MNKSKSGGDQDMHDKKTNRADGSVKKDPAKEEEIIEGEIIQEGAATSGSPETGEGETAGTGISTEEYNALAEELQQAQEKTKDYFDGWQRERADFANYKRRIERDQQSLAQNITGEVAKKYLGVLDDLERAMKNRPTEGAPGGEAMAWASGIELIMRKVQAILEAEGVRRIPAETEEFNPTRHEAITYEDSPDHKSGEIIEVVQQGYTLGDRVLRPALVRVARG
jgi:molecular chaperone GrpE